MGSRTEISRRHPNTASANSRLIRTSASEPGAGPRRRPPPPDIWPKKASKMSPRPPSKPKPPRPTGLIAEDALGPEAVVAGPLLGVAQDLVGQRHLFELRLGDVVPGIVVRVQFPGAGPVGLLDLVVGGLRPDAQEPVQVAQAFNSRHRGSRSLSLIPDPAGAPPRPVSPSRSPSRSPTTCAAASARG